MAGRWGWRHLWFRPHPLRVLAIGVGAIVLWFLAVYAFDSLFGWTA